MEESGYLCHPLRRLHLILQRHLQRHLKHRRYPPRREEAPSLTPQMIHRGDPGVGRELLPRAPPEKRAETLYSTPQLQAPPVLWQRLGQQADRLLHPEEGEAAVAPEAVEVAEVDGAPRVVQLPKQKLLPQELTPWQPTQERHRRWKRHSGPPERTLTLPRHPQSQRDRNRCHFKLPAHLHQGALPEQSLWKLRRDVRTPLRYLLRPRLLVTEVQQAAQRETQAPKQSLQRHRLQQSRLRPQPLRASRPLNLAALPLLALPATLPWYQPPRAIRHSHRRWIPLLLLLQWWRQVPELLRARLLVELVAR